MSIRPTARDARFRSWLGSLRGLGGALRLAPFETATEAGRASERYRRVALSALAAALAKGISILTALVSVPLTIGYLGTERYGLWMTITSAITVLQFADLGLGNGLLNAISTAHGKDDREMASTYSASAFFLLGAIATLMGGAFVLLYPTLPWARFFNVASAVATAEAGPAVAVLVGCFLVNIPLGIVQRIQMGYQEGFANSLWTAVGNLLGLCGVLVAIRLRAGLPWLVLMMAGAPALASLLNGIVLFGYKRPWLRPRWDRVTVSASRQLLRLGVLFFVLQLASGVAFSSDNIILARLLGPAAVAQYSVAARMFSFIPTILAMVFGPLWPAYGESLARGDGRWAAKTLRRSLLLSGVFAGAPSAILVALGPFAMKLWVGSAIAAPDFRLLLGLGLWTVVMAVGNAVAMFLNGAGIIGFQAACAAVMAIAALSAKVVLTRVIGVPGVVWGTVLAYALFVVVPFSIYVPQRLSRPDRWAPVRSSCSR